jgi:class 3 adenylate cyclase/pimeloyl-ACP methyl ester carboxylesterase
MREPQIRYAKTSDGVSIAYSVFGDGPPVIYLGAFPAGIHLYSQFALARGWTDRFVESGWQIIRFDFRGTGSSDRDAVDITMEARLRDLDAVVERVGLQRFAVVGHLLGAINAIAYTANRSSRVSRLALSEPIASGGSILSSTAEVLKTMRPLLEDHWELMTLNIAHLNFGFSDSVLAGEFAAALRSGLSAAAYRAWIEADESIDVTGLLDSIKAPTLVVSDTSEVAQAQGSAERAPLVKKIAAGIPNATFLESDDAVGAITQFLGEGDAGVQGLKPPSPMSRTQLPSGTAIILFADIVDSTALTERLGDTAFREKARELNAELRRLIRDSGGWPVEGPTLGDGLLATFPGAKQAIEAALACAVVGNDAGLPLHLGLHAGDVLREKDAGDRDNVYGGTVNIAARISGLSAPGEVLVSDIVRGLARTSAGVRFEDRGEQELKGVGEPVRVWVVRQG